LGNGDRTAVFIHIAVMYKQLLANDTKPVRIDHCCYCHCWAYYTVCHRLAQPVLWWYSCLPNGHGNYRKLVKATESHRKLPHATENSGCLTLLEILEILEIYWNNFASWKLAKSPENFLADSKFLYFTVYE